MPTVSQASNVPTIKRSVYQNANAKVEVLVHSKAAKSCTLSSGYLSKGSSRNCPPILGANQSKTTNQYKSTNRNQPVRRLVTPTVLNPLPPPAVVAPCYDAVCADTKSQSGPQQLMGDADEGEGFMGRNREALRSWIEDMSLVIKQIRKTPAISHLSRHLDRLDTIVCHLLSTASRPQQSTAQPPEQCNGFPTTRSISGAAGSCTHTGCSTAHTQTGSCTHTGCSTAHTQTGSDTEGERKTPDTCQVFHQQQPGALTSLCSSGEVLKYLLGLQTENTILHSRLADLLNTPQSTNRQTRLTHAQTNTPDSQSADRLTRGHNGECPVPPSCSLSPSTCRQTDCHSHSAPVRDVGALTACSCCAAEHNTLRNQLDKYRRYAKQLKRSNDQLTSQIQEMRTITEDEMRTLQQKHEEQMTSVLTQINSEIEMLTSLRLEADNARCELVKRNEEITRLRDHLAARDVKIQQLSAINRDIHHLTNRHLNGVMESASLKRLFTDTSCAETLLRSARECPCGPAGDTPDTCPVAATIKAQPLITADLLSSRVDLAWPNLTLDSTLGVSNSNNNQDTRPPIAIGQTNGVAMATGNTLPLVTMETAEANLLNVAMTTDDDLLQSDVTLDDGGGMRDAVDRIREQIIELRNDLQRATIDNCQHLAPSPNRIN